MIPDGFIDPGSPSGVVLGFTAEKFEGWLWKQRDRVIVSMIVSLAPFKGHLSQLFDAIEAQGLRVAVATPLGRMASILRRKGFVPHIEYDDDVGPTEVWEKPRRPVAVSA